MKYGNKTEKPGGRKNANNMGGNTLDQPGPQGGKGYGSKPGSLNQPGAAGGKGGHSYGKGFDNKPIPANEQ